MAAITQPQALDQTIPRWVWIAALLSMALLWLITFENGEVMRVLGQAADLAHETFHDGRHLLGVPCH